MEIMQLFIKIIKYLSFFYKHGRFILHIKPFSLMEALKFMIHAKEPDRLNITRLSNIKKNIH